MTIFTPIFVQNPYGFFVKKPIFATPSRKFLMDFADFCRFTCKSKKFKIHRKRYIVKKVGEKKFYEFYDPSVFSRRFLSKFVMAKMPKNRFLYILPLWFHRLLRFCADFCVLEFTQDFKNFSHKFVKFYPYLLYTKIGGTSQKSVEN